MAIPEEAIQFEAAIDPQEVLDWEFPMDPVLEDGEAIDPLFWDLALGPEAMALGLEIVSGDGVHSDPHLIEEDRTIKAWLQIDQDFAGDPAFQGEGTAVSLVATARTTAVEFRKRQRTFIVIIKEQ